MNKIYQYTSILLVLTAIAGSVWYFNSTASTKINSSQETKLTDGLVGHWPLDGNYVDWSQSTEEIRDATGNGYHGDAIDTGGTDSNVNSDSVRIGKIGQGIYLDWRRDYINLGDVDALEGQQKITLSAWVNVIANRAYGTIFTTTGGTGSIGMYQDNDTYPQSIAVEVSNPDWVYATVSDLSLSGQYGEWHLWTMVFDGSQSGNANRLKFFFDGVQKTLYFDPVYGDVPSTTPSNNGLIYLGNSSNPSPDSIIDEARAYNRALSVDEITELYNQGQAKINASQETKLTDGLVLYQSFDGNHMDWSQTSAEARDQSGQSNHGNAVDNTVATAGKIGQALEFDGAGDYVEFSAINHDDISVSLWFNRETADVVDTIWGGWYWNSNVQLRQGHDLRFYSGLTRLDWTLVTQDGGGTKTNLTTNYELGSGQFGNWYHAAVTYNSATGEQKLYVDGDLKDTEYHAAGNVITPLTSYSTMRVGHSRINNGYFPGKIDEVRVYSRAISQNEVTELYSQGQAKINASQETKLTDGLVGNWTFDGNHMDWSATGAEVLDQAGSNNGNASSSGISNANAVIGKVGQALDFNNASTHNIQVPYNSSLNMTTALTVSAWVNLDQVINRGILEKTIGGTVNEQYLMFAEASRLKFRLVKNSSLTTIQSNSIISADTWYHVSGTWDGSIMKLFVNGVQQTQTANVASPIDSGTGTLFIGSLGSSAYYMDGTLDEVRIYNRALSVDEINQLYMMGK
ncbi:LamG-like jellyroll fold domain-containing protein [Patescibacteria group bacterium]